MATDSRPQRGTQSSSTDLNGAGAAARSALAYAFGRFRLDVQRRILTENGTRLRVKPKALDLLVVLIECRDRVVDKDELMSRLWPDTFVEEANLTQHVFLLRKALGEVPGEHRFIDTIAKRGYRFVSDVTEVSRHEFQPAAERPIPGTGAPARGHVMPLVVVGLLAAVFLLVANLGVRRVSTPAIRSIAVLPLRDLSQGARERYVADSLTDALIADLGSVASLRVTSRTSSLRFRESPLQLPEIARALGVDALVDGSFVMTRDRIQLTTRLIDGPSGRELWSEVFEMPSRDIRTLDGAFVRALARVARATITETERVALSRRQPVDPEAYDVFLRARYYWGRRGPDDVRRSIEYYRQSTALDPTFAAAHGGLALAHCLTVEALPREQVYAAVKAAAKAALALDPSQPDALVALTQATVLGDRDWRDGLRQFERILARYPNSENAIGWYGSLLADIGRTDDALAIRRRWVELDPWSLAANNSLGVILSRVGRYEEAVRAFQRGLEIDPSYADTRGWLGWTLIRMGRTAEGLAESEEAARISKNQVRMVARLAHAYALAGRPDDARRMLAELEGRSRDERVPAIFLAHVHAGLGEADAAFVRLDQAFAEGSPLLQRLLSDPQLEALQSDPRYGALARRLGLPWP